MGDEARACSTRAELIGGNGGAAASRERASGENEEEAERVQASRQAAVRFPFQDGQRAARSGRAERVADTRRLVSVAGRP